MSIELIVYRKCKQCEKITKSGMQLLKLRIHSRLINLTFVCRFSIALCFLLSFLNTFYNVFGRHLLRPT